MQVRIGNGKDVTMSRYQVVEGSLLAGSSIGMCWLRPPESGVDLGYTHLYQFIPVALPTPFFSFLFYFFDLSIYPLSLCTLETIWTCLLLRVYWNSPHTGFATLGDFILYNSLFKRLYSLLFGLLYTFLVSNILISTPFYLPPYIAPLIGTTRRSTQIQAILGSTRIDSSLASLFGDCGLAACLRQTGGY